MEFPFQTQSRISHRYGERPIENEINLIIIKCLARIRSWRSPCNWSYPDWLEEAQEVATIAAWQAVANCEPQALSKLLCFVHQRILSAVRTRYRQEFLYGLRFGFSLAQIDSDSDEQSTHRTTPFLEPELERRSYSDLVEALAKLPDSQRIVIEQLFLNGRTEMQLAAALKISRVAINKRKRGALRVLRELPREE